VDALAYEGDEGRGKLR